MCSVVSVRTYSAAYQGLHPESHSFNKLLWPLNGSLKKKQKKQTEGKREEDTKPIFTQQCFLFCSYLIRFIKEGLHPLRQASDEPKRISKDIQTQHQYIHLFNSL